MRKVALIAIVVLCLPHRAYAYVDPGFLGSLYQLAYLFIFGTLAVWVMKPVQFFKSLFKKKKKDLPQEPPESPGND